MMSAHPVVTAEETARVQCGSHVTLHYRIALRDGDAEREVISTLDGRPATLQIGGGSLPAPLEEHLIGLREGDDAHFDLPPGLAYGVRTPELVQTLSRGLFDANADPDATYQAGDLVEFNAPDGRRFSGVLKAIDDQRVVVDFNHPLAGAALAFSVQVIGVL